MYEFRPSPAPVVAYALAPQASLGYAEGGPPSVPSISRAVIGGIVGAFLGSVIGSGVAGIQEMSSGRNIIHDTEEVITAEMAGAAKGAGYGALAGAFLCGVVLAFRERQQYEERVAAQNTPEAKAWYAAHT